MPVPAQVATGNFMTAALWNANIYNGMNFLLNPPIFSGYQVGAQSIAANSWTSLAVDTTIVDSYGGHSNTTNNSRYTAQVAGWYACSGIISFLSNSTGFRAGRFLVNATVGIATDTYVQPNAYGGSQTIYGVPTRQLYLNAGDYVELQCWHNSGGALSTSTGAAETTSAFDVRWVHA